MRISQLWRSPVLFKMAVSLIFLSYCILLADKSIAGLPITAQPHTFWPWLGDRPVGEDGYYMLTVARNMAATHSFTYNNGMQTTGIQPLATVMFGGVDMIARHFSSDRWFFVRMTIAFGSLIFVLFSWMMSFLASAFAPPPNRTLVGKLAFILVLSDLPVFRLFTYGLETGIYLCLLAACLFVWRRLIEVEHAEWSSMVLFGFVAGVTGLARIDFGLCFLVLLIFLVIKRKCTLLQVAVAGMIALMCVIPWFFFVHRVTGSWLPSSGWAEGALINSQNALERLHAFALAIVTHLVPWSGAEFSTIPTYVLAFISVALLVTLCIKILSAGTWSKIDTPLKDTFIPWMYSFAVLAVTYTIFFWSTHFYVRYFSPIIIVSVPLLSLLLSRYRIVRRRTWLVYSFLLGIFCVFDYASFHTGQIHSSQLLMASYVNRWYPVSRVAAFQSGTIGFFNPNVENIDGKINYKALVAAKEHKLPEYIDQQGIEVIIDWPFYIQQLPEAYRSLEWRSCPQPTPDVGIICLIRKTHD